MNDIADNNDDNDIDSYDDIQKDGKKHRIN